MRMSLGATNKFPVTAAPAPRLPQVRGLGVLGSAIDLLMTWQERAEQRGRLATMDRHLRSDLGLDQSEIEREISKPFWQA